jgi:hypothetical protein
VNIQFTNTTSQTVDIYWLDYNGQRFFYQSLGPGLSYVQPTYETHPWLIADSSGTGLQIFYPVSVDAQAFIQ